jgi:hypothetical protein
MSHPENGSIALVAALWQPEGLIVLRSYNANAISLET